MHVFASSSTRHGRGLLAAALLLAAGLAQAQDRPRIEGRITKAGFTPVRIAVPGGGSGNEQELIQTLRDDLTFSGFFDVIDPSRYRLVTAPGADGKPRHQEWIGIGADALVQSTVSFRDNRIDLMARLYDNASAEILFHRRYQGTTEQLRLVAHQLADDLVRQYTGKPGVAMTRIAFVSQHGQGKEIYLMDYDGKRIRRLTTTGILNLSPVWAPDGNELAFVSWRGRQPGIYVMSSEGKLGALKTLGGELSSAPDWSADGRQVTYSSNVHGNTEIYVLDRASGRNRRLTHSAAIDTSPAFSPNGREIVFTSDRAGTPQLYLMDAEGLNVRRVSWEGSYNDSGAWHPDGGKLAYASRAEGRFDIVVLDLVEKGVTRLTHGEGNNENPRWSPNGRHLVFASSRTGSYQIYTMRADGSDVRRLTSGPASFTPDWSH